MAFVVVLVSTALFFAFLERSGLIILGTRVLAESKVAFRLIVDPDLPDDAKEVAVRHHAVDMLRLFARMSVRMIAIFLAPAAVIWAALGTGATDADSIRQAAFSWPILTINILLIGVVLIRRRAR